MQGKKCFQWYDIIVFFLKKRRCKLQLKNIKIGIDAITMTISGENLKHVGKRIEKRNKQGHLYLEVNSQKQNNMYNVIIILPSIIRPSNLKGFSLLDAMELKKVIRIIKHDLQEVLGTQDLERFVVKKLEVNANKIISPKVETDVMIELISNAMLESDVQQTEHCHGKKTGDYKTKVMKKKIIDGIRTGRHSSGRYYCKIYRKDRQLGLENKMQPTLRIELEYNSKGILYALKKKEKVLLTDILKISSMQKLIQRYVLDIETSVRTPIYLYLKDATKLVLEDLMEGSGAYNTFLKKQEIIKYDFKIFRVAMLKYFKLKGNTKQSAIVQCSRIKAKAKKQGIVVNEGTVQQLKEMFKEIELQKV